MDADKYAEERHPDGTPAKMRFGIGDLALLVSDLRELADIIEKRMVCVEEIYTSSKVHREKFPTSELTVKYSRYKLTEPTDVTAPLSSGNWG